jgi:CheY-like chemotaxis protein
MIPGAGRPLVLCVDDEPTVLASLRRALRQEPYDVVTTGDPSEALRWAVTQDVGVLVTDHRMPGMTGAELLAALAERSPATEGVLLTAYPSAPQVLERAASSQVRVIAKPWTDDVLRRTIRELLEQRTRGEAHPAVPIHLWSSPDISEILLRIDCGGRQGPPLLDEVDRLLNMRQTFARSVAFILENLPHLEDSLSRFLKTLVDRLTPWDVSISFIDRSGRLEGIVDLFDPHGTIAVYGSEIGNASPKSVLILEDNPETLGYLHALVLAGGHKPFASYSVSDVFRRTAGGPFDLAFLDLCVSGGGAIALSQRLLAKNPFVDIVALSALSDLWDEETCIRLGFWRRLEKPYRVSELLHALESGGRRRPRA